MIDESVILRKQLDTARAFVGMLQQRPPQHQAEWMQALDGLAVDLAPPLLQVLLPSRYERNRAVAARRAEWLKRVRAFAAVEGLAVAVHGSIPKAAEMRYLLDHPEDPKPMAETS